MGSKLNFFCDLNQDIIESNPIQWRHLVYIIKYTQPYFLINVCKGVWYDRLYQRWPCSLIQSSDAFRFSLSPMYLWINSLESRGLKVPKKLWTQGLQSSPENETSSQIGPKFSFLPPSPKFLNFAIIVISQGKFQNPNPPSCQLLI